VPSIAKYPANTDALLLVQKTKNLERQQQHSRYDPRDSQLSLGSSNSINSIKELRSWDLPADLAENSRHAA
jgi:hypothetical protein